MLPLLRSRLHNTSVFFIFLLILLGWLLGSLLIMLSYPEYPNMVSSRIISFLIRLCVKYRKISLKSAKYRALALFCALLRYFAISIIVFFAINIDIAIFSYIFHTNQSLICANLR